MGRRAKKVGQLPTYLRFAILDIEQVHDKMDTVVDDDIIEHDDFSYRISSRRLPVYKSKGVECRCGRVGEYYAVEVFHRDTRTKQWKSGEVPQPVAHLNLYGNDPDGTEFMMTIDHIIPKAKGGGNGLSNLVPMCSECNRKKGATVE